MRQLHKWVQQEWVPREWVQQEWVLREWVHQEWVRQEACQQSQADPARIHPDQGTVGWPEQVFPVSAVPPRQQPMCPGRQQVISTEGPLLPARELFDPIHMYAGVGTCGHDVQFRTPSVLDLAPAEDTVSQVNQVTNV